MVLKEVVEYNTDNAIALYIVMLDATKAFNRVDYCKLFDKLIDYLC